MTELQFEQAEAVLDSLCERLRIAPPNAERTEEHDEILLGFIRMFYHTGEDCGVVETLVFDDNADGNLQGQPGGFLWTFDEDGNPIAAILASKKVMDAGLSTAMAVLIHQLAHVVTLQTGHGIPFLNVRAELRREWEDNTGMTLSDEDMAPHIELGYMKQERTGA